MKERSLLYFIAATLTTLLFLLAIIFRFSDWYADYGYVLPTIHKIIFPVALLWLAWYFRNNGFALAAGIILTVSLGTHFGFAAVLNSQSIEFFVPRIYGPMVRTSYLIHGLILTGTVVFTFLGYYFQTKEND
jgi:hypothetical protein